MQDVNANKINAVKSNFLVFIVRIIKVKVNRYPFLLWLPTVAAMRSAGLRGYVPINRDKPCLRELNLQNL